MFQVVGVYQGDGRMDVYSDGWGMGGLVVEWADRLIVKASE